MHPTRIAIEVASFFMPSAFMSNAIPFKTLEKLFTTFATFFRTFFVCFDASSSIFPTPESTLPTPLNGAASTSRFLFSFLTIETNPMARAPANIPLQFMLPTNSAHLEANPLIHSQACKANPLTPFTKPKMKFSPSD